MVTTRTKCEEETPLLKGTSKAKDEIKQLYSRMALDDFVPADHVCRVIDAFVENW